ncbi:MAG: hypothetical protein MUE92_08240 [Chloroflexi bacterium]|nr:hypothetical protein [Chloroflexota bacterium]
MGGWSLMGLSIPSAVFELAAILGVLLTPVLVGGFVLWFVRAYRRGGQPASRGLVADLVLVAAGMGWCLFALSSMHDDVNYLGGPIVELQQGDGFDPWTGEPHGRVYLVDTSFDGTGPTKLVREPAPSHLGGRRAIPVWVGFGATLLVGGAILAGSRRRPLRLPAATES